MRLLRLKYLRYDLNIRFYSKGTKKLTVSFDERNAALKQVPRSDLYPLLTNRRSGLPTERIKNILTNFKELEHTTEPNTTECEIRGRVNAVRMAGKGLMFLDVQEGGAQMQVVVNAKKLRNELEENEIRTHSLIRRGDSISATGYPWRTKAGELSLLSSMSVKLLAPSLHPLPDDSASKTIRKHNRVAELKTFSDARDVLRVRSTVIKQLADFLNHEDFLQVQTPHLSSQKGGASAQPFKTTMADGTALYLRVAPELWLKRLIVGGFDRVFEVGYSYRNEGIDSTHNPEFTTCEFYMAFATLEDLISLSRRILQSIAASVAQEFPQYAANCEILTSQRGWKVIDFIPELEKHIGRVLRLDREYLIDVCSSFGVQFSPSDDIPKLLDNLAGHFLESQCDGPTFIINHPSIMAPLAKEETNYTGIPISRRFEFFVGKREYINAYEEENDPLVQFEKLKQQNPQVPDSSFVEALEWGLPPTGGWGLGVDRLVMLLTGSERIGDILAFGDLNQVNRL